MDIFVRPNSSSFALPSTSSAIVLNFQSRSPSAPAPPSAPRPRCRLDARGELCDALLDLLVLSGLRRKQVEHAAPARDAFRQRTSIDRLLRLAREGGELGAVHEAPAARAREQRGSELGAAALAAAHGGRTDRHDQTGLGTAVRDRRNGPLNAIGRRLLIFHAS